MHVSIIKTLIGIVHHWLQRKGQFLTMYTNPRPEVLELVEKTMDKGTYLKTLPFPLLWWQKRRQYKHTPHNANIAQIRYGV
jgi:hypothetical protein